MEAGLLHNFETVQAQLFFGVDDLQDTTHRNSGCPQSRASVLRHPQAACRDLESLTTRHLTVCVQPSDLDGLQLGRQYRSCIEHGLPAATRPTQPVAALDMKLLPAWRQLSSTGR